MHSRVSEFLQAGIRREPGWQLRLQSGAAYTDIEATALAWFVAFSDTAHFAKKVYPRFT